jgi:chemotaxis protein CheX
VDPNIITPFIKSTQNIFEMMLSMDVSLSEPAIKTDDEPSHDVSGIIGFTGGFEGSVVLSFPEATALRLCSVFTGSEVTEPGEDLNDAIGELVNMIAGGAKASFNAEGVSISCPNVIYGKGHKIYNSKEATTAVLPCDCDCGPFSLEVTVKKASGGATAAQPQNARAAG